MAVNIAPPVFLGGPDNRPNIAPVVANVGVAANIADANVDDAVVGLAWFSLDHEEPPSRSGCPASRFRSNRPAGERRWSPRRSAAGMSITRSGGGGGGSCEKICNGRGTYLM
ncbi:hypothetical protein Salat_1882100 [Sesamum alatum]|uniref:Uncharacterized protein n=1 Tax=Sesamum alatum TaxID=300844 RepID=A0AAE1Y3D4_9LAMI|nr:hypothetical protein Salat_1882100 [Sesamum alatum]